MPEYLECQYLRLFLMLQLLFEAEDIPLYEWHVLLIVKELKNFIEKSDKQFKGLSDFFSCNDLSESMKVLNNFFYIHTDSPHMDKLLSLIRYTGESKSHDYFG